MNILFTGTSSFTGYWFIRELIKRGHHVTATLQKEEGEYTGIRGRRVKEIQSICETIFSCPFGSEKFFSVVAHSSKWDVFCHHAAEATDYKSPAFDAVEALEKNTRNLQQVLSKLQEKGLRKVLLTGSVFERREGTGSEHLPHFSPYGLSKGLTAEVFHYYCRTLSLPFAKFVIANPFGPLEEPRFTTYLARLWLEGETPSVNTPLYVRDNIPVSLLAQCYADFVEAESMDQINPSFYVESQGAFAQRFAREMEKRFDRSCPLILKKQTDFAEPRIRINTDPVDAYALQWNEEVAWDELADYYLRTYQPAGV